MQLTSGGATFISNTAYAATEQLQQSYQAVPCIGPASVEALDSCGKDRHLHLRGLPADSLQKAKQAWQKLLVERLYYLQ